MKTNYYTNDEIKQGCIDIWIDEIVPCLKETETGEIKETVVFRLNRKQLINYKKINGWHINWSDIPEDVEVYALALEEDHSVQGIIGIKNDFNSHASYIHWACTAPHNNKHENGIQKYSGVGGHLFAIAADKAIEWGYEGAIHGFAANEDLLRHYIKVFHAEYLAMLHQYQFFIDENQAQNLLEVYRYDWKKA